MSAFLLNTLQFNPLRCRTWMQVYSASRWNMFTHITFTLTLLYRSNALINPRWLVPSLELATSTKPTCSSLVERLYSPFVLLRSAITFHVSVFLFRLVSSQFVHPSTNQWCCVFLFHCILLLPVPCRPLLRAFRDLLSPPARDHAAGATACSGQSQGPVWWLSL